MSPEAYIAAHYGDDDDDGRTPCPKCDGDGTVNCYCGGDQCYCTNEGEKSCSLCYGKGEATPERAEKYLKAQREMHAAWQKIEGMPKF